MSPPSTSPAEPPGSEPAEPARNDAAGPNGPGASPPAEGEMADIATGLAPERVRERVRVLARRGRLEGYEDGGDACLFTLDAWGTPISRRLVADAHAAGTGTRLRFSLRWPRLPLWIALAVTAFTVWPGVWLTDRFLRLVFGWYNSWAAWVGANTPVPDAWFTSAWYLPLTVLPLPWMYKKLRRQAEGTTLASATEQIALIRAELSK